MNAKKGIILIVISFVVSLIISCLIYHYLTDIDFIESMIKILTKASESKEVAQNLALLLCPINLIIFGLFTLGIAIVIDESKRNDKNKKTKVSSKKK